MNCTAHARLSTVPHVMSRIVAQKLIARTYAPARGALDTENRTPRFIRSRFCNSLCRSQGAKFPVHFPGRSPALAAIAVIRHNIAAHPFTRAGCHRSVRGNKKLRPARRMGRELPACVRCQNGLSRFILALVCCLDAAIQAKTRPAVTPAPKFEIDRKRTRL